MTRRRKGTTSDGYVRVSWRLDARIVDRVKQYAEHGLPGVPFLRTMTGLGEGIVAETLLALGIEAVERFPEPKGPDTRAGERKVRR